jgi:hypothetical protein
MPDLDDLAFQLAAISNRLRELGEGGLARELSRSIGDAVDTIPPKIRAGLDPKLPNRYARVLEEDVKFTRRTFTDGDGTRVSLYASNATARNRALGRLDEGILWHPLFGRFPRGSKRNRWFEQGAGKGVQPGWFTKPVEDAAPQVREVIRRALDDIVEKAVRGA